jgi:hypothetical protein
MEAGLVRADWGIYNQRSFFWGNCEVLVNIPEKIGKGAGLGPDRELECNFL